MTLRHQSSRRAREQRARRAVLARSHGPDRCQWPYGCASAADDAHERLTRARGGSITDPDNLHLLCRHHHDVITHDTDLGERLGLVESQYKPDQP